MQAMHKAIVKREIKTPDEVMPFLQKYVAELLHGALAYVKETEAIVKAACSMLKTRSGDVTARLSLMQEELKAAEHKVSQLENKMASAQVSDIDSQIRTIKDIRVLVQIVKVNDMILSELYVLMMKKLNEP